MNDKFYVCYELMSVNKRERNEENGKVKERKMEKGKTN